MKLIKLSAGFGALVLTFVGVSFLVGPFIPSLSGRELGLSQQLIYATLGALVLFCAVKVWIWSLRTSAPE